ncbi:type II toxin-antitoxin system HicA family toxin [Nocardiopsis sp. L17-MgMaSL7]|uniref:type II toxin-antitoxin system HicA family toxin n=1 Tax=Nocardiopsis sp. L17-MgMaSL7 TaxID=1938893 RepID=UPI000D71699F|nr:type II toxin-antitoxin system HicA family toxin [Nocardiopsis sp. L17-MgMaSL7]PWV51013.1 putative RNA binding protein YcfA (HicA-like mRNA interferase family) [Nocardiopsis sp. L17-MgMaSL7]
MSPSHIPISSGAKVVAALRRIGFEHVRTKGDHAKLRKGSRVVIVPLHKELKRGTTVSVLKQAGLTPDELRDLL